jgi:hypothetical protein
MQKIRTQIQDEWTRLRSAEGELESAKRTLLDEQQKEQARLLEWESKLKRDEAVLLERQRILDLKESDLQRRQNPWLNSSSGTSVLPAESGRLGALDTGKKI